MSTAYIRAAKLGDEPGIHEAPEVLHQGFGLKLAKLMLNKARSEGATEITLDSSLTAHAFYKHLGFKDTGPLKKQDIGGYPVSGYPMKLELKSRAT